MKQIGTVVKTEGEFAYVKIEKQSSCSGDCSSCSSCKTLKEITARTYNKCNAEKGDTVYVSQPASKALFLAALTYIFPLLIFFIFSALCKNETAAVIVLLASFLICALLANTLAKTKYFMSITERIDNADF